MSRAAKSTAGKAKRPAARTAKTAKRSPARRSDAGRRPPSRTKRGRSATGPLRRLKQGLQGNRFGLIGGLFLVLAVGWALVLWQAEPGSPSDGQVAAAAPAKAAPAASPQPQLRAAVPKTAPAKAVEQEAVKPVAVAVAPPRQEPAAEPAWRRNAAGFSAKPGQPLIAIVLDDLGVNRAGSRKAVALPGPLTLAFLPYADDLPRQTAAARKNGHELLIHMPMEPEDLAHNDPGPNALLLELSDAEVRTRLDWAMGRFSGYVGINNHMGSAFTADRGEMDQVMRVLSEHGLLYLDSVTSAASSGGASARSAGVPTVPRDIFLDHAGDDPGLVLKQLAKLEAVAKRQGYAVAIGHPHAGTLTALEMWIPDVKARGFALVPISALVSDPRGLRG